MSLPDEIVVEVEKEEVSISDADKWGGANKLIPFTHDAEDRLIGEVPLERIKEEINPFENNPWHDENGVSMKGVKKAIENNKFNEDVYSKGYSVHENNWGRKKHEERIAYLVMNPSSEPISIEFSGHDGMPFTIDDGHHRLAAAIYRNDPTIKIEAGGWLSSMVSGLGIICHDYIELVQKNTNDNDDEDLAYEDGYDLSI